MIAAAGLAVAVGAAGVLAVVLLAGPGRIWALIRRAGWWVVAVAASHLIYEVFITLGWRSLLASQGVRRPFLETFRFRWAADAAQALFPVPEVGSAALRGWLLARKGVSGSLSIAVIIVELTLRMFALVAFIVGGLALLLLEGGGASAVEVAAPAAGLAALIVLYYVAQRRGLLLKVGRRMERVAEGTRWVRFAGGMGRVDEHLPALYGSPDALTASAAWHLLAWMFGAVEVWILLHATGNTVGLEPAVIMESIGQAGKNAGFFIPAGLGAQEGAYLLGARVIGLTAAVGVSVALLKRVRDVLVGLPALALVSLVDGRVWRWLVPGRRR